MTIIQNTFDGTDATNATVTNLATSGDAAGLVSKGGAATWTYAVIGKYSGATGLRFISPGASADKGYVRFDFGNTSNVMRGRVYFTLNTLPSVAQNLVVATETSTQLFAFGVLANNTMRAVSATGGSLGSTSPALVAETRYRLEWQWRMGTTTTDGQLAAQLYVAGATTAPIWNYAATNVNVGVTPLRAIQVGDGTGSHVSDITFDNIYGDDGAQTPAVGPYVGPATATLNLGSLTSNPGGFTKYGTAVDMAAGLADGSDTTGIQSPVSPVNAVAFIDLPGNLATGTPTVSLRLDCADTSSTATAKVMLCYADDTTAAPEQTYTVTTTPTTFQYTLTSAQSTALTTRTGLRLKVTLNA